MNKVTIITHLPFRKMGNQSLKRFVEMFLNNRCKVVLITDGQDPLGENSIDHENLEVISLEVGHNNKSNKSGKEKLNASLLDMKSHQILLPYIDNNPFFGVFKKQIEFLYNIYKQFHIYKNINGKYSHLINDSSLIIGYEASRSFVAKKLARDLKVPYINKYQGTVLRVCGKNILKAILYYPKLFFGINKSDLCLMVNDGTDGEFWAKLRGNNNIRFRPHGVSEDDYRQVNLMSKVSERLIIFNNASSADWKRTDRILRALSKLSDSERKEIRFVTTFFGPSLGFLKNYVEENGLNECVEFVSDCDHIKSNEYIRNSSLLIMTNDMSNLGNPILESIYYNIPFITINDGSLAGICEPEQGGMFVDISPSFDEDLASLIRNLVKDRGILELKSNQLKDNTNVRSLIVEQRDEYEKISKLFINKEV
ncbi:TPA: glycosyltransferase [Vibrio harveyi]|nr:glycosyltransferase [Vibrio harveyi]